MFLIFIKLKFSNKLICSKKPAKPPSTDSKNRSTNSKKMSTAKRSIQAKRPPLLSERVKLYLWIALAYFLMCRFSELVQPDGTSFWQSTINSFWITSYLLVLNFLLFERTLPFFHFHWKRLLVAPFLLAGHLLLYPFGTFFLRFVLIKLGLYFELKKFGITEGLEEFARVGFGSVVLFGIVQHIYTYFKLKQTAQKLRIEKQAAELNYLKSQTNPHFLFNTLNNIYSLSKDKSDLAPDSILRLSEILRFTLYHTNGQFIPIEKEVKVIRDYISLEKLRYDDSLRVEFQHDLPDPQQPIPPLLLIPLVENAFKHGASETRAQPFVKIRLSVADGQLYFLVKNSVEESPAEPIFRENIGLSNLRRQLELLFSDFELNLEHGATEFAAELKINLDSHV